MKFAIMAGMWLGGLLLGISWGKELQRIEVEKQTVFCLANAVDFELCAKQYGWIK